MLMELSNLRGVSGAEGPVRDYIQTKLRNFKGEIIVDSIGNLLVRKNYGLVKNKIMLSAHMDEVGLMVVAITQTGQLKFKTVGGIDSRVLVAKRVLIGENEIPGVIGVKPVHLQKAEEKNKPFSEDSLLIDAGFNSREEAEQCIKTGDYVSYDSKCADLGSGYYRGKAFDDRIGCLILLNLLLEDNEFSFDAAFTVQEEVGTRGAIVAAYHLHPHYSLVVETTAASDTPGIKAENISTTLNQGPAISFMDQTIMVSKKMRTSLFEAAKQANVSYQFRRFTGAGTEGGAISLSGKGVQTAVLSVPCRYIHSPASVVAESDIQATEALVRAWLERLQ